MQPSCLYRRKSLSTETIYPGLLAFSLFMILLLQSSLRLMCKSFTIDVSAGTACHGICCSRHCKYLWFLKKSPSAKKGSFFDDKWELHLFGWICAWIWFCDPGQVISKITCAMMFIAFWNHSPVSDSERGIHLYQVICFSRSLVKKTHKSWLLKCFIGYLLWLMNNLLEIINNLKMKEKIPSQVLCVRNTFEHLVMLFLQGGVGGMILSVIV